MYSDRLLVHHQLLFSFHSLFRNLKFLVKKYFARCLKHLKVKRNISIKKVYRDEGKKVKEIEIPKQKSIY